jgi:hypothetical protein
MITEVDLSGTPCFAPGEKLSKLNKINFIFGPNGSGKTTLSKIFQNNADKRIHWGTNDINEIHVFNREFTANALARSAQLEGVFFIGKGAASTQAKIDTLQAQLTKEEAEADKAEGTYKAAIQEEHDTRSRLDETAWNTKKKLESSKLFPYLKGALRSKASFTEKLLNTQATCDEETTLNSLIQRANRLQSGELHTITTPPLNWTPQSDSKALEQLLPTPIIPTSESTLLPLIQQYGTLDWVTQGHNLCKQRSLEHICPYCQQEIPSDITAELELLFDTTYNEATSAITTLLDTMKDDCKSLADTTEIISRDTYNIPSLNAHLDELRQLSSKLDHYKELVAKKNEHPSRKIDPPYSLAELHTNINKTLTQCLDAYRNHNKVASNVNREEQLLKDELWAWLATKELHANILTYHTELRRTHSITETTKQNYEKLLNTAEQTKAQLDTEIGKLRNTKEAMVRVNSILQDLGFTSFKLDYDSNSKGYKLIRPNSPLTNCDVNTLSEGEKTILTFLYFIQNIDEAASSSNSSRPIVIIDDPIASTDSQTFFLITQIIRRLTQYLKDPKITKPLTYNISQLIVCTHNTRFLSEVSYDCTQGNGPKSKYGIYTHYYTLEKEGIETKVYNHSNNSTISTEYKLLWDQIKDYHDQVDLAESRQEPIPQFPLMGNIMRRIIETYSKMIGTGGITRLSKSSSVAVAVLMAFCNSSSHNAIDVDLHSIYTLSTKQLLGAFRQLFETELENGAHFPHYCAMMGIDLAQQGWTYPPINKP